MSEREQDALEERPSMREVELAIMVCRPGVRHGVKPGIVLAREVRWLRAEREQLTRQLGVLDAKLNKAHADLATERTKFAKMMVYVQQLEAERVP